METGRKLANNPLLTDRMDLKLVHPGQLSAALFPKWKLALEPLT